MAAPPQQSGLEPLVPPEVLARYEILRPLGQGGMGDVFLARSREVGAEVAIKVLRGRADPDQVVRFLRECEAVERLDHPGLAELYEYGSGPGGPYMVMRYVEGVVLSEKPALHDPAAVMTALAEAIEAIHGLGLVHRDVKPANVILDRDGEPVLIDFGVVLDPELSTLTKVGGMVGTLCYMAPELLRGARATPAADWFAWGVTAFEVIEGVLPFSTGDMLAAMQGLPPSRPELRALRECPGLGEAVLRALEVEPAARLGSAQRVRQLVAEGGRTPASTPGGSAPAPAPAPQRCRPPHQDVPEDPAAAEHYAGGLALVEQGDLEEARASFKRALMFDDRHPGTWRELGASALREGSYQVAHHALENALGRDPEDPDTVRLMALTEDRLGRDVSAQERLRRFLELCPPGAEALIQDARARLRGYGCTETLDGETISGLTVPPDPDRTPPPPGHPPPRHEEVPVTRRKLPGRLPRLEGAEEIAAPASESDRAYMQALDLLEVGDQAGGEAALRRAFLHDPRHRPTARELGFLLAAEGQHGQALHALDRAHELGPEDLEVAFFRGLCLVALGRADEGEAELRRFLGGAPSSAMRPRTHAERLLEGLTAPPPVPGGAPPARALPLGPPGGGPRAPRPRTGMGPGGLLAVAVVLAGLASGLAGWVADPEVGEAGEPVAVPITVLTNARNLLQGSASAAELVEQLEERIQWATAQQAREVPLTRLLLAALLGRMAERGDAEACRTLGALAWVEDAPTRDEALRALSLAGEVEGARELMRLSLASRERARPQLADQALELLAGSPSPRAPEFLVQIVAALAPARDQDPEVGPYLDRVERVILGAGRERMLEAVERDLERRKGQRKSPEAEASIAALRSLQLGLEGS